MSLVHAEHRVKPRDYARHLIIVTPHARPRQIVVRRFGRPTSSFLLLNRITVLVHHVTADSAVATAEIMCGGERGLIVGLMMSSVL